MHMSRLVYLPSGRLFVIGGSNDLAMAQVKKDTLEVVYEDGEFSNLVPRAPMW